MNRLTEAIPFQSVRAEGPENTLAEYVNSFKRRAWLIVACALGCAGAAAAWSFIQTPMYQAKATVVIEGEGPEGIERDKVYRQADLSPEYFQTQFELMKSHFVLQRTSEFLHLSEQPEYRPRPSAVAGIWDLVKPKTETPEMSPEEFEERLLKRFVENIEVTPIRGARLAYVTATSEDPKFAALAANALVSVYIERNEELNAHSKEKAAQWFTTHLNDLRKKVETSQQTLYQYRVKHGLLGGQGRQAVTTQTNTELDTELVRAEMKKAEVQSRFEQIRSVLRNRVDKNGVKEIDWSSLNASAEVLGSVLIQTLRAQDIKASGQVAELAEKYGPLHPKLARAKAELEDLRERIRQEVQKIFDSVKQEYDTALGRVRAIKEAAGLHRQEKIRLEQHDVEYGILEREAESSQHLYEIFLKQTKEADLSIGLRASNVYLADPAVPSSFPAKPKKQLNTLLGLLVGLMTGVGIALTLEARDKTIKGPDDVERYLPSISLLGMMPLLPKAGTANTTHLLTHQSSYAMAENVRTIRTNVLLSNPNELPSCVLVTSPGANEGKTVLSESLAIALAQLENTRVILIDADLRKPAHDHILGVQLQGGNTRGLVDFLEGRAELEEIIHQTKIANLSVIPRGKRTSNPSELIHSKPMSHLLNWCRQEGFHVVLDAPPVLPVTDAMILANRVDGVLLVACAGQTPRLACQLAIHRLTAAGGKILGIVLQKAQVPVNPYYYYVSDSPTSSSNL